MTNEVKCAICKHIGRIDVDIYGSDAIDYLCIGCIDTKEGIEIWRKKQISVQEIKSIETDDNAQEYYETIEQEELGEFTAFLNGLNYTQLRGVEKEINKLIKIKQNIR